MAEVEQILKNDNYKHFASRETGDDIERPDVQGLTMLMWASAYGQTPTVQVGFEVLMSISILATTFPPSFVANAANS